MGPSKVELAVLNNLCWHEAMFAAHGLACETDGRVWRSDATSPPFHSNLVVLSPTTTAADIEAYAALIERLPRPAGWSLKDSYACLDLASRGYTLLFHADWIWRDPLATSPAPTDPGLRWEKLVMPASLFEWEQAWAGDTRNEAATRRTRQFPDSLLGDPDFAFFAGRAAGKVVAGGIANRSPGVVGLSNTFLPGEFRQGAWSALVRHVSTVFPETPIVGYERGDDLDAAFSAGFASIGKLRVWYRST